MEKSVIETPKGVFDVVMPVFEELAATSPTPEEEVVIVSGVEIVSYEVSAWMLQKNCDDARIHDSVLFAEQQARIAQNRLAEKDESARKEIKYPSAREKEDISLDIEYIAIRLLSRFWARREVFKEAARIYRQKEGTDREEAQRVLWSQHLDQGVL